MSREPLISVVVPVRNKQSSLTGEVYDLLEMISELTNEPAEIVIVDDDSDDLTAEVADELSVMFPQVRTIALHHKHGLASAGQIGLERTNGEYVFIQEDPGPVRAQDLRQLWQMRTDESLIAARASAPSAIKPPLFARLRGWGQAVSRMHRQETTRPDAVTDQSLLRDRAVPTVSSLQMIRRKNLHWVTSNDAGEEQLEVEQYSGSYS